MNFFRSTHVSLPAFAGCVVITINDIMMGNYDNLTATSLEMMFSQGSHPKINYFISV